MPVDDDIPSQRFHVIPGRCNLTLCDKRRKDKLSGICENKGVCVPTGKSSATCDCKLTGYDGPKCTKGTRYFNYNTQNFASKTTSSIELIR